MGKSNSRVTDMWAGVCLADPVNHSGPQLGMIITGSSNHDLDNLPQARKFDIVLSFCGHTGIIVTGSSTVQCNNVDKARITDIVMGQIAGVIITGSGTSEST